MRCCLLVTYLWQHSERQRCHSLRSYATRVLIKLSLRMHQKGTVITSLSSYIKVYVGWCLVQHIQKCMKLRRCHHPLGLVLTFGCRFLHLSMSHKWFTGNTRIRNDGDVKRYSFTRSITQIPVEFDSKPFITVGTVKLNPTGTPKIADNSNLAQFELKRLLCRISTTPSRRRDNKDANCVVLPSRLLWKKFKIRNKFRFSKSRPCPRGISGRP